MDSEDSTMMDPGQKVLHLEDLCRLCGREDAQKSTNGSKPKPKEKYSKDLSTALGLDISQDDPSFHPPYVCQKCDVKLGKWRQAHKKKKKHKLVIDLVSWPLQTSRLTDTPAIDLNQIILHAIDKGLGIQKTDSLSLTRRSGSEILYEMTIYESGKYKVDAYDQDITGKVEVKEQTPSGYVNALLRVKYCPGNRGYDKLCRSRNQDGLCIFKDNNEEMVAFEESFNGNRTVRHKHCRIVVEGKDRCEQCSVYRKSLNIMSKRAETAKSINAGSKVRNSYLSNDQLRGKMENLKKENANLKRKNRSLEEKLQDELMKESIQVNKDDHDACNDALKKSDFPCWKSTSFAMGTATKIPKFGQKNIAL